MLMSVRTYPTRWYTQDFNNVVQQRDILTKTGLTTRTVDNELAAQ